MSHACFPQVTNVPWKQGRGQDSASAGDLELDVLFEDHRVSWLVIDDMFALELATSR